MQFIREQAIFFIEYTLVAALDCVESCLPSGGIDYEEWEEQFQDRERIMTRPSGLCAYQRGAVESAGMVISCFYAHLTGHGIGVGDALDACGDFYRKMERLTDMAWKDDGERIEAIMKRMTGTPHEIKDYYGDYWPDCHQIAVNFVDNNFGE